MILGCIADDLTGATDLSLMLSREGLRTIQITGVPNKKFDLTRIDAVVVALKSRTIAAVEAVEQSLAAADWLLNNGAQRLFFKYCSTFDSTDQGNIGPVTEAMLAKTGDNFTIACPAFPANGRSIFMGILFVNGVVLAESPMRNHPLTPMRDSDLRRVLGRQISGEVGHVAYSTVELGPEAIKAAFASQSKDGKQVAIVDALNDMHLRAIGKAAVDMKLLTGGSGLVIGLPVAYLEAGLIERLYPPATHMTAPEGRAVILAGSCSAATRAQVQVAISSGFPAFRIDPIEISTGKLTPETVLKWLAEQDRSAIPLIYSSDEPENVEKVQKELGLAAASHSVENLLANVAKSLPELGFSRFVVAGGETSGAVVEALGISALSIGPEIDPGVPWTSSHSEPKIALALKSGNFGTPDFFLKAWNVLA